MERENVLKLLQYIQKCREMSKNFTESYQSAYNWALKDIEEKITELCALERQAKCTGNCETCDLKQ